MNKDITAALDNAGIKYAENEPMKKHTSFRIGGPADLFVSPENVGELKAAYDIAKSCDIPVTVVGNGSNLLVSDKGIEGMVICLERMNRIAVEDFLISAQAGALLGKIAAEAAICEFTGMEFAAGIPGSVGGAVVMNAGAYGGEMKDIVAYVRAFKDGKIVKIDGENCGFGYRHSIFSEGEYIIVEVVLNLSPGKKEVIHEQMKELALRRREKQPLEYPSAGSTFKRPEGNFAGALIEQAGLKGFSVGDAQVSEKHAGFVINKGNATCEQVLELVRQVKNKVFENSGVMLEEEIKVTGRRG